jgi:hypothetical protein
MESDFQRGAQVNLSPHFSLEELVFSQVALRQGLDNTPDPEQVANLRRLCLELLEPARLILGVPLHIDSGYRSPKVNAAVGGDPASRHMNGEAADCLPIGMPLQEAFDRLRLSNLPYQRIIFECRAWIHLGQAHADATPLRMAETATGHPGAWQYQRVGETI